MPFRKTMMMMTVTFLIMSIGMPMGYCADVAKIGTVNFQEIFEKSTGGQAVKDQINTEGRRMEQDLKQKGEEIKALEKQLDQGAGVMSKSAREERKWEYERKIDDVKALKQKYDRKIQELQMQLVNEVRQDVLKILQDYGKKEGYLLIIDNLTYVYAPEHIDITDAIIKLYNEQYAKSGKKNQGPKE